MLNSKFRTIVLSAAMMLAAIPVFANGEGTYVGFSPYTIYGVGSLQQRGAAYNKTMGGVGVASRNTRFINITNPASVTARDSLSMMIDFSVFNENRIMRQGDMTGVNNVVNINDLAVSFPVLRKSAAMMVGLSPYSSTGYGYSTLYESPELIGRTGSIAYAATGQGNIYQVFVGLGFMLWNRLSIGAEYDHFFGEITKKEVVQFENSSFSGNNTAHYLKLNANTLKLGLQYEQPIGKRSSITVGGTYRFKADAFGDQVNCNYSAGDVAIDTISYKSISLYDAGFNIPTELGVGVAFNISDKFRGEFNYYRSDWRKTRIDDIEGLAVDNSKYSTGSTFRSNLSQEFRLGFEYTPSRNDIRYYYKKWSYRIGAYYKTEYYTVDNHSITNRGITLGATLPVFRWSNGITFGMEVGQRGTLNDNLIRETCINFMVGFNLYDIWFQKIRYE